MNKPQRTLTIVFLVLFAVTLLLCPYDSGQRRPIDFSPFLIQPKFYSDYSRIDVTILHAEWIILGVFYAGLFALFRKPNK
jgi:hypothetical protein